jgi:hypothetical protein
MLKSTEDRVHFTNTMRYLNRFLDSYIFVKDLEIISRELEKGEMTELNKAIERLKQFEPTITELIGKKNRIMKRFIEERVKMFTTNPYIKEGLRDVIYPQRDLNWAEALFDSLFDTENTIAANLAKIYKVQMVKKENKVREFKNEFYIKYKKFAGNRKKEEVIKDFIDRYVAKDSEGNPTGYLIQKFDKVKFYEDKRKFLATLADIKKTNYPEYKRLKLQWEKENQQYLTEQDGVDVIDAIRNAKENLTEKQLKVWMRKNIVTLSGNRKYWKEQPSDKYLDKRYEAVDDDEFFFYLRDSLAELASFYKGSDLRPGQLPYIYAGTENSIADKILSKIGYVSKPEQTTLGENEEIARFIPIDFYKRISFEPVIKIPQQNQYEAFDDYEKRVIQNLKDAGINRFKSLEEVKQENYNIQERNRKQNASLLSYDIEDVMLSFAETAYNYKFKKEIESEMLLIAKELNSDRIPVLQRDSKGKTITNRIKSELRGENSYATSTGENSRISKRVEDFIKMIFYEEFEADEGNLTKIARILQNFTSAKSMWFNITGGINNLAIGQTQIAMERYSQYFWNREEGNKAEKSIWSAILNNIAFINTPESKNKEGALIKLFNITETHDERNLDNSVKQTLAKHLFNTDVFYIQQHLGEYYMQNKGLLAMLYSHRIIDGKIKSLVDFKQDLRKEALKSVLSETEKEAFESYLKENKKQRVDDLNKDYIKNYILTLSKEIQLKYVKKIKELNKEAETNFKSYKTVYDSVDFIGGFADKSNLSLDENEYELFVNKIVHVNQKIHGIYNKMDAGSIQNLALGRLGIQFRKHMRPGWNKRFGSKLGSKFWNESRNDYDKGSYVSLWNFLTEPIRKSDSETTDTGHYIVLNAAKNIFSSYANFIKNIKIHWHTLDEFEKANVRRAANEMLTLVGFVLLGALLRGLRDDDKDNYAINLSLYQQSRLQSELLQFTPIYGWFNETRKLFKSPAASENLLEASVKLSAALLQYPFQDDEERVYQSGIYAGQNKINTQLEALIPIKNQWNKMQRINNYVEYYKLFRLF